MRKKTAKLYTYEGLGFPVNLINAPLIEIRGEFVLDVDFNKLQKAVLLHLSHKKGPLTGNEVKFIRKYFGLTATKFAELLACTHAGVLKWENREDNFTKMAPTTEIYIRLSILEHLNKDASDFKDLYQEIRLPELVEYSKIIDKEFIPISINIGNDLTQVQ